MKIADSLASILCAMLMSGSVAAATSQAHSTTYFDESGNIVGQQILLCSNLGGAYGNIHTAYTITQYASCTVPFGTTHPASIVAGTHVTSYTLPGFLSIQTACSYLPCQDEGSLNLQAYWPIQLY